jgi:hypothetical protein
MPFARHATTEALCPYRRSRPVRRRSLPAGTHGRPAGEQPDQGQRGRWLRPVSIRSQKSIAAPWGTGRHPGGIITAARPAPIRDSFWISLNCGNVVLGHAATGLCRSFTAYVKADMPTRYRRPPTKQASAFTPPGGPAERCHEKAGCSTGKASGAITASIEIKYRLHCVPPVPPLRAAASYGTISGLAFSPSPWRHPRYPGRCSAIGRTGFRRRVCLVALRGGSSGDQYTST